MSRTVSLAIVAALAVASSGFATASINASLTASDGKTYTGSIAIADIPAADANGNTRFEIKIPGVPVGSFSGTVYAVNPSGDKDAAGVQVSFSGSVPDDTPNEQLVPVTVQVSIGAA